jgi:CBS domain containing-hemolysin-like protein
MDIPLLLAMVGLLALSGFFSASETAFSTMNRTRIKTLAQEKNKKAKLALKLSEDYGKLISTILVGNNIVNISLSSIATVFFLDLITGNESLATFTSTAVITVAVLTFGEISPKTLAKESPEKFAMFSAPFMNLLSIILTPVNFIFNNWNKLLLKVFKIKGEATVTEDDLLTIVDEAETVGGIDEEESKIIRSAIEFNDLDVHDVLTPRVDVVAVSIDDSIDEIRNAFRKSGFSRLPVYKDTIDNVLGVINQKDFYEHVMLNHRKLKTIIAPAKMVTPFMKISDLMKLLQRCKSHMAIVIDEYGGTLGIVTLEDIIEELVGEIWDEHDEVTEEIVPLEENVYEVSGALSTQKLFGLLDVEPEEEDDLPNTVAGLVMRENESIPTENEKISYQSLLFTVLKTENSRIERLKVEILAKEENEET